MARKMTVAIPELRLTKEALQRHTKVPANRPIVRGQPTSSELDNSFPSTDHEGVAQIKEIDQIFMDPGHRRDLLVAFSKDSEFFDVADTVKTPVRESSDLIDPGPTFAQPCFLAARTPQVSPEQNTDGTGSRSLEESAQQSIDSNENSTRLIQTSSVQEDQLRSVLPSHFPQLRHVQNHRELGFYIDRSQYAISVGPGPLDDLHYGIIIVPFGEEHMLFRSEHEPREVPLVILQQSPLRSVDEVQPRTTNSASLVAATEPPKGPAPLSKCRAPPKRNRNIRDNPSRITKATRARRPQTYAPPRRSQRLKAGAT